MSKQGLFIKQGHIDRKEAVLMLWFTLVARALFALPTAIMPEGMTASWMIPLGGGLVALAAFFPGALLMKRFGRISFPRAADEAGGLVIGKIAGLAFWTLFLVSAALALREFAEAISTAILPRTPIDVLIVSVALAAAYAAYLGPEAVGRLAIFLAPWLVVFLAVILVAPLVVVDLGHLFPLWGTGLPRILGHSLLRSSLYAEVCILLILYPYLRAPAGVLSAGVWVVALSAFVLAFVQVVVIMAFDVASTDRLVFPVISLVRLISFGRFLARLEPLGVLLWVFFSSVQIAVLLWAAATALAETLRLSSHRPLFAPLTAILIAGSSVLTGEWQTIAFDYQILRRWAWVIAFAAPLGLWLLAVIRGKKSAETGEQKGSAS